MVVKNSLSTLPVPLHFSPANVGEVWKVDYERIARDAGLWRDKHSIKACQYDELRVVLIGVDVQNTFCIPGFELFVSGRTGRASIDDNIRLCEFIYRNIGNITHVLMTLDTHHPYHIFHQPFFLDADGNHPDPYTRISNDDITNGRWMFNTQLSDELGIDESYMKNYLDHYTRILEEDGKYDLTIWPYHAMMGGIGHSIVSAVEEAVFFYSIARHSSVEFIEKGLNPLTEHYSAIKPEIINGPDNEPIDQLNDYFLKLFNKYDIVIVAGQAKSHCVAYTVRDIIQQLLITNHELVRKIYVLEDCTSPVVIPDVIDYTEFSDVLFNEFTQAGVHLVKSTEPMEQWPGILELTLEK